MSEALVAEGPDMGHCHASLLPSRAVLRIGGADARKFLQGLVTNDIDKAQGGAAVHTGLLSPQGKILFDFFAVPDGDGFLIDVAEDKAAELMKRLGFYRLRAAVEIAAAPSLAVAAAWGGPPAPARRRHCLRRPPAARARLSPSRPQSNECGRSRLRALRRSGLPGSAYQARRAGRRPRLRVRRRLPA